MAAKKGKQTTESFEDSLDKLRAIVRDLEEGNTPLEESLSKFQTGMELAKSCQERLTTAEQKIEELVAADKDGIETKPFKTGK